MTKAAKKSARPGRWRRRLVAAGVVATAIVGGSWVALHEIPGFGPMVADGARKVVGPRPIAWLEDLVYGAEDRIHLAVKGDEAPKTFWEVPAPSSLPAAVEAAAPPAFSPPYPSVAAKGDGTWIPVRAATDTGSVAMYKALIHPDPKRPYAAVAVVAMDRRELDLRMVAGTEEPESPNVPRAHRTGIVPTSDDASVVAVFNGGFKAMHGGFGMRVGSDTFLPPRDTSCTVALLPNDDLEIRTFSAVKGDEPSMLAYRQTPPCLVERGETNAALTNELNKNWGASVSGDTIIRRSAIGLSKDKRFLYYALGDAVTAHSIAEAMRAVGAYDAAQLDVNYAYPRFMLVARGKNGSLELTQPLVPDLKYGPTEYVGVAEQRDFFYVLRKRPTS